MSESNGLSYASKSSVTHSSSCLSEPPERASSVVSVVGPHLIGKAQRNASHQRTTSVDSIEKKTGSLEAKGAEIITKDPRASQRSKVTNSSAVIRGSMVKVMTTTVTPLPRVIVAHHQHA